MTTQTIVEAVLQHFPNLGITDILIEIDRVQKLLASETESLTTTGQLSSPSTNTVWDLPSNCKIVTGIEMYDSDDMELYLTDDDVLLTYEIINETIAFYSLEEESLTGLPSAIDSIYIDYIKIPTTIDAEDDTLELAEQLHQGILSGVLQNLYARIPSLPTPDGLIRDFRSVTYWRGEYDRYRIIGKRLANDNKDKIERSYVYDVLGNPVPIRRQKRSDLTGSISVSPLLYIYSKYLKFTAVSPSTITIVTQFGWTTEIATPTITDNVITVLSDSEFTATMFAHPSIGINYERVDADSWTFDVYDNWGTLVVEIYELS